MHDAADLMWQVLLPPAGHRSGDAERRAFPRWQAAFPVLHGNGDEYRMGAAVDLSEDGLRFVGFCDYGKDAVIHLHMQVGSAAAISAQYLPHISGSSQSAISVRPSMNPATTS